MFPTDHLNYLQKLKHEYGFEPKVIYDIGACVVQWTNNAKTVWPDAEYYLFDANENVRFLYEKYNYNHWIGLLSSDDSLIKKYYYNELLPTGNSYYRENTNWYDDNKYELYATRSLESIVSEKKWPQPDLIKIDVQGAEQDILKGARSVLDKCEHMIVEMQHQQYNRGAPMVGETLPFIEQKLGFKCIAPLFSQTPADGDYGFQKKVGF